MQPLIDIPARLGANQALPTPLYTRAHMRPNVPRSLPNPPARYTPVRSGA
jgi:hypothetical protein